MATPLDITLSWSSIFAVAPKSDKILPGDKILLPQSALEALLSASTVSVPSSNRLNAPTFDPFNPYSLAAARAEQSQWQDRQQQLPHPLTFRLVNSANGNVVFAGIREFSAEEGEVGLSPFLLEALGVVQPTERRKAKPISLDEDNEGTPEVPIDLTDDDVYEEPPRITVHAKQLPKGTYVRLRPLEAGYNPEDWKSLLEKHLRENFTTLTNGEILTVRGSKSEEFRFLIDKFAPEGDGICVVDTDLEVDIEALNEEQARETMKQIMAKAQKAPGTTEGSSIGGDLSIWKPSSGQVLSGDYVDYTLPSWDRTQGINISLTSEVEGLELFVSPFSPRQRARPREDEHVFGDFSAEPEKSIKISATNIELENAEALNISIYARPAGDPSDTTPREFAVAYEAISKISLNGSSSRNPVILDSSDTEMEQHSADEEQCKNCTQWIPKRSMMLHENFCLRNNILCPHCTQVFQKKSADWANHWHCDQDSSHGNTASSRTTHDFIFHTSRPCPNCPYEGSNLRDLASHRTSSCPGKIILCQFCHLEVPQEGDPFSPSAEALISGLTAHELADGARTTDCHLCGKIIRLRDMSTHLKHHELEKVSRAKPEICRNINCGRTLHGVGKNGEIGAGSRMGQGPGNELGLCSICYGPLYVSMHDPEGRAMRRRIERRYISQLISGCGKAWCRNVYCKTAKSKDGNGDALTTQLALPMVRPLMEAIPDKTKPCHFCVDEGSQKRRVLAEMLGAEGVYELEWCVAGLEAEGGGLDNGRVWLGNWAPKKL
ncbi:related to PRLI-interacting factor K [Rhynchosporium agropyri]|uniref:Related to PRLI-interacting factor K n=1 Tax=Rhynchosporium agropyri TaxID=914238 RepID=A0A1E1LR34_9HELO|nr:related to PRLI-interacting factor K [Rhynchosporium agropyri]